MGLIKAGTYTVKAWERLRCLRIVGNSRDRELLLFEVNVVKLETVRALSGYRFCIQLVITFANFGKGDGVKQYHLFSIASFCTGGSRYRSVQAIYFFLPA